MKLLRLRECSEDDMNTESSGREDFGTSGTGEKTMRVADWPLRSRVAVKVFGYAFLAAILGFFPGCQASGKRLLARQGIETEAWRKAELVAEARKQSPTVTLAKKVTTGPEQLAEKKVTSLVALASAEESQANGAAKGESQVQAPKPLPDGTESVVPIPEEASVTLNQVIYAALHEHPVISAELEAIQQAQADYLRTTLFPNPQLFTDVQLLPLTRPFTVTRQGGPPQQDVVLTYPIDWFLFGKRTAAMTSAHYGVHVSQADFENMIRLRVQLAAETFYTSLEAKTLLDAARENVDNLKRVDSVTKLAVENGGRPAIELSRVRLDVLAAEQRLRTAEAASKATAARLRAVMGGSGVPLQLNPDGDLGTMFMVEPLSTGDAYEMAKVERPDLKAIQWRMTKAGADIEVERRAARPVMAPSFGYTRQYQQKAIGYPDADSWSSSLNMSVPIFDRNQGNIAKAEAIHRRAYFGYEVALLDIEAEVEQVVAELKAAQENAKSVSEEQLQLAAKVRDSIVESYEAGGRTLIEVLDAQRNYRETYLLYISSRANYWRALYRYYATLGRKVEGNE